MSWGQVDPASADIDALLAACLEDGQKYWGLVAQLRTDYCYGLREAADFVNASLLRLRAAGHQQAEAVGRERELQLAAIGAEASLLNEKVKALQCRR